MAKKHRKPDAPKPLESPEDAGLSRRGKRIIAAGVASIAVGFIVLTRADPRGQNWASIVSPLMILGGYALVGLGILAPDAEEAPPTPLPPPPAAG